MSKIKKNTYSVSYIENGNKIVKYISATSKADAEEIFRLRFGKEHTIRTRLYVDNRKEA